MANRSPEDKKAQEKIKTVQGACVRCGSKNNLRGHHLIHVENGGSADIRNMVTLCHECHMKQHHGENPINIVRF